MKKRVVVTLDSQAIDYYLKNGLDVENPTYESSLAVINGVSKYFNSNEVGFITPKSLKSNQEIFEKNNNKLIYSGNGINADLLFILGVDTSEKEFSSKDLETQHKIYKSLSNKLGRICNKLESKERVKKDNLYNEIDNEILPKKYDFKSWEDINNLVSHHKNLILKHIDGAGGDQVHLLKKENFELLKKDINENLSQYILQEYLGKTSEKRIVIFGEDVVGSRVVYERITPWARRKEKIEDYTYKNIIEPFNPTPKEKELALYLHNHFNLDFSAIDFVECENEKSYLMEINAIHPGMICSNKGSYSPPSYNLGDKFGQFVKEMYEKM